MLDIIRNRFQNTMMIKIFVVVSVGFIIVCAVFFFRVSKDSLSLNCMKLMQENHLFSKSTENLIKENGINTSAAFLAYPENAIDLAVTQMMSEDKSFTNQALQNTNMYITDLSGNWVFNSDYVCGEGIHEYILGDYLKATAAPQKVTDIYGTNFYISRETAEDLGLDFYTAVRESDMYGESFLKEYSVFFGMLYFFVMVFVYIILSANRSDIKKLLFLSEKLSMGNTEKISLRIKDRELSKIGLYIIKTADSINNVLEDLEGAEYESRAGVMNRDFRRDISGSFYSILYTANRLMRNRNKFWNVMEIPVLIVDSGLNIMDMNRTACFFFGKKEFKGQYFYDFANITTDKEEQIKAAFQKGTARSEKCLLHGAAQVLEAKYHLVPVMKKEKVSYGIIYFIDYTDVHNRRRVREKYYKAGGGRDGKDLGALPQTPQAFKKA